MRINEWSGSDKEKLEENQIQAACRELTISGKIPFNEEFSKINGGDILKETYFHNGIFTEDLKKEIESWDLRKKFIHLGDAVFYDQSEDKFFYERTLGFNEKEASEKGLALSQKNEDGGFLESTGEFDVFKEKVKKQLNKKLVYPSDVNEKYMLLKTSDAAYLIRNFSGNNNYHHYPKNLLPLDNPLGIARMGDYRFSKLPVDMYDELKDKVISRSDENLEIFDEKFDAVEGGRILTDFQYPGLKYGESSE